MNEKLPLISVIVPVYRVEEYLSRCLESILGQSYRNLEILLVDDGSPDGCPAICDKYAEKDPRIRVIHKENGGLSDARNAALDIAEGDYIGFVDSDDWIRRDMYRELMDTALRLHADITLCGYIETDGKSELETKSMASREKAYTVEEAFREELLSGEIVYIMCNKIYRKSLFDGIRFPLGENFEDGAVFYKLFGRCGRIAHTGTAGYYYRKRPGSITFTDFPRLSGEITRHWEGLRRYLEQRYPGLGRDIRYCQAEIDYYLLAKYLQGGLSKDTKEYRDLRKNLWRDLPQIITHPRWTIRKKGKAAAALLGVYSPLRAAMQRARQKKYELQDYLFNRNLIVHGQPEIEKHGILIMVYSLYGGGAERVASFLAEGFAKSRPVTVVTIADKGKQYGLPENVRVIVLPLFRADFAGQICWEEKYVKRLKQKGKVRASISLMYRMNRLNVRSGGFGRGKTICSERNNPAKREPEHMAEIEQIYQKADHVVFQSAVVRDLFGPKVRAHSSILPNPVSVECEKSPDTKHRIVNIGRLNPQKNQKLLIGAFAAFSREKPEYTLSIYGGGELLGELESYAKALGVEEKVIFHGNTEHVHKKIADAEMFVLSSDYEGLSNALLECMMMGIPCISTACEGSADVIKDGENGLLTGVGNQRELTEAMLRLAGDPEFREKIGRNARETARRFEKEKVLAQWIRLADGR